MSRIVAALAVLLALAGCSSTSSEAKDDDGMVYTATQLAERVFDCATAEAVEDPTGGALERVTCMTADNHEIVVSTFGDAATARRDGTSVAVMFSTDSAMLVGPYWTFNCPEPGDCDRARKELGGALLKD